MADVSSKVSVLPFFLLYANRQNTYALLGTTGQPKSDDPANLRQ